jgi:Fanconi anemia group M protein
MVYSNLPYFRGKTLAEYVNHPLIREGVVEKRDYQLNIVKTCLRGNTLVILPTGLGKTVIAALLAAERLSMYPDGKCFVLAPTKPLTIQHYETFKSVLNLNQENFAFFTGETPPSKRSLTEAKIVFLTPQVLLNDLIAGRISLENVVLMVFDEAHRAVGNYPYVLIAELYKRQGKNRLIVGLTASPGSTREKIDEVRRNLDIRFVEARTEENLDVKPYIQPVKVEWVEVELSSQFKRIEENLKSLIKEKLQNLYESGFLEKKTSKITFKEFLGLKEKIKTKISSEAGANLETKKAMVDLMCVRHASHALELLETQGLTQLKEYFSRLKTKAERPGNSSAKEFLLDGRIQETVNLVLAYETQKIEHPKTDKLLEVVEKSLAEGARRIIVFTNYRETSKKLVEKLNMVSGVKAVRLVGQTDKQGDIGLSQKEQAEILSSFREGKFNVLVATQVAEEGIDVASSDVVVFYDNVPSAVRFIQRRGRTGRVAPGKVVVLIAKGTRDHVYYRLARWKEKLMLKAVRKVQVESGLGFKQEYLERFIERDSRLSRLTVLVDSREANSAVVRELVRFGVNVKLQNLPVGDYVISEEVVVERKTVSDFVSSIIDKRLFTQAKNLVSTYLKPVFIVEGENLYSGSGVSAKAIRGAILSLNLDYKIPVVLTKNPTETASYLVLMAEREQLEKDSHPTIRGERKPLSLKEQQEYVVAGLPNVELTLAKRLLAAFGSVEKVFQASKEELKKVPGIGETIAEKIRKVITAKYNTEE